MNCTCIPGHFLCPEAVRLWNEHSAAYQRQDWVAYEETKRAYNKHIGEVS